MGTGVRAAAILLLTVAAAATAAGADDATLDQDLAAARQLMKDEKWEPAAGALLRAVESRRGSAEVRDRLKDIEEDLKLCLFRSRATSPTAEDLFGPCAKSLARIGRKLVLEFPNGPQTPEWAVTGTGFSILPVRFEGEVSMTFRSLPFGDDYAGLFAVLCYDPDRETGYALTPGFRFYTSTHRYELPTRIARLDGKTEKPLGSHGTADISDAGGLHGFRVSRKQGRIEVLVDAPAPGPVRGTGSLGRWSAADSAHRSGVVGLKAFGVTDLVVTGTLEEMSYRALVSTHYARRFREWEKSGYKREEVLPAWALTEAPRPVSSGADVTIPLAPPDAGPDLDPAVRRALAAWSAGKHEEFLALLAEVRDPAPATRDYLEGLACLARNSLARAEELFSLLVRKHPNFAPGFLFRGMARFGLRNVEGARADLDMAWDGSRSVPDLYVLAVALSVFDGDLARAQRACDDARRAGVVHEELDSLAAWIRRSVRGPSWVRRFEQKTPVAVIVTDHSQELCADTAVEIGGALAACVEKFGRKRPSGAALRVHVFSSREGFLEYSDEVGRNLESAAGAYVPLTNEMVLFVPDVQRESLWRTIRHETFHFFVHGFLDEVPVWFDEGYAQWFENGRGKGGSLLVAGIEADAARTLRAAGLAKLTPLRQLLLMETPAFRAKAALHYAQSQALVRFLNEKKSPHGRTLQEYFESLLAGLSREEAFEKHWAPVLGPLESGFREYLGEVFREVDGL